MKVLVVGSGGREHALAWKIAQSPLLTKLYCAPGNAGMSEVGECVDISATDLPKLVEFAKKEKIDLTVVGPEAPLVEGIADLFQREGLLVFGPNRDSSQLEGSKIFSKKKMESYGIRTARFRSASDFASAKQILDSWGSFPVVIKADGLAAGKGVVIAECLEEAMQTLENYFVKETLGDSGKRVVIEECLRGEELSILALTDGKNVLPLASSQDHKRAFEGDQGPNTGGMGAYSPCPFVKEDEITSVVEQSVTPLIQGLAKEGIVYRGLLYAGLILTEQGPFVLEYNVRFGDPETQAVLPRLKSDLLPILLEIAKGELKTRSLEWDERFAVTVVMASKGYPDRYEKGFPIEGFKDARNKGCLVFHAGTSLKGKAVVNSGGRVLAVTGLGESLKEAAEKAYQGIEKIKFSNSFCRRDIAKRMYERSVSV